VENTSPILPTPSHLSLDKKTDRWLFVVLFIIVALAPLPLGANRPLPMAMLGVAIGMLLILWSLLLSFGRLSMRIDSKRLRWPIFFYFIVCLWILIQWMPGLPFQITDPIWKEAGRRLGEPNLLPHISVNPNATLEGLMHLLAYAGIFWLTFQFTRQSERAWTAVRAITIIGSLYALYGIIIYMTGNGWILIYPKWSYPHSLTSTFVNRNSYASFAGLTLLCAVSLFIKHLRPFFALRHPLRSKIAIIVEQVLAKAVWKTAAILIISTALLLSTSRAGVASTLVGLLCLLAFYLSQQRLKKLHALTLVVGAITAGMIVFAASGNHISKRLEVDQIDSNFDVRKRIYNLTWEAIMTSPWKGTGFGTFADVFPAYRDADRLSPVLWDKAHNTYLENALELGLPAALLLNLALALLAIRCARGVVVRRRDKLLPALGVGASILVGLHSLVDFSLQIPAVAILYACIMGLAVGQSWHIRSADLNEP
jgi:hypothetical protein